MEDHFNIGGVFEISKFEIVGLVHLYMPDFRPSLNKVHMLFLRSYNLPPN